MGFEELLAASRTGEGGFLVNDVELAAMRGERLPAASTVEDDFPGAMAGVREYAEEMPVGLSVQDGRFVVQAYNEGGCNRTQVDLLDLLAWLRANRPELLEGEHNGAG